MPTSTATLTMTPTHTPTVTSSPVPTSAPVRLKVLFQESSPIVEAALDRLQQCAPETYAMAREYVRYIGALPPNESAKGWRGMSQRDTKDIFINASIVETAKEMPWANDLIVHVIAHESRHQWQYVEHPGWSFDEQERDAHRYQLPLFEQCPCADPLFCRIERMMTENAYP